MSISAVQLYNLEKKYSAGCKSEIIEALLADNDGLRTEVGLLEEEVSRVELPDQNRQEVCNW